MRKKSVNSKNQTGFTLIELLVVLVIIGLLASIIFLGLGGARKKARDAKRKTDLAQMGRVLYASVCYAPNAGTGDYDLAELIPELKTKYPQLAQFSSLFPKDPKTGNEEKTQYRYGYTADGHCVLYANFENEEEPITLLTTFTPTPNAGMGVFRSTTTGPNDTPIFFQIGK